MTRDEFWQLIATERTATGPDSEPFDTRLTKRLTKHLRGRPEAEQCAFAGHVTDLAREAYSNKLWGAAYLVNGGCSDDGFHYFLIWLVSMGREVYAAAVADPDSLAGVVDPKTPAYQSSIDGAACDAWTRDTGRPEADYFEVWEKFDRPSSIGVTEDESWDFEDDAEMTARLPRLAALYVGPGK